MPELYRPSPILGGPEAASMLSPIKEAKAEGAGGASQRQRSSRGQAAFMLQPAGSRAPAAHLPLSGTSLSFSVK